jgi:hypothetical protein
MSNSDQNVYLGYNELYFNEIVDKDLKGSISSSERSYLVSNPAIWKSQLVCLKRRTEMQFTSSKARSFSLYREFSQGALPYPEYVDKLNKEKEWRCNAARFLQQIEIRIQETKALNVNHNSTD